MNLYKINPYVRIAINSVVPNGINIKTRIIYDYEFIYVEEGNFIFTYGEKDYRCKTGDFIFIRPKIPHSFHNICGDLVQPHVHFDFYYDNDSKDIPISFKNIDAFSDDEKQRIREDVFKNYPLNPFVTFSDSVEAIRLLKLIIGYSGKNILMQKACLTALISMIISKNFPEVVSDNVSDNMKDGTAKAVKEYIDSAEGVNSSLTDLEKLFSYSKFYLERIFRQEYGISIIKYRNNVKMNLSQKLLETLSVTETAEKLGYSSVHSFCRAYKNHFGINAKKRCSQNAK